MKKPENNLVSLEGGWVTARFNVLVIRDDSVAAGPVALVGLEGEPEPGQSPLLR